MMERSDMDLKINMVTATFRNLYGREPSRTELLAALGSGYAEEVYRILPALAA